MKISGLRIEYCLFATTLCLAIPAVAMQVQVLAAGAQVGTASMYLCSRCTDTEYVVMARTLGPGRHLLVDWHATKPRSCVETGDAGKNYVVCGEDGVSAQEQHRFDLAKRLWTSPSPIHFREAELGNFMRAREVDRTVSALGMCSALRYDLTTALQALLPALPSGAHDCKSGESCARLKISSTPDGREAIVELTRGGSVTISWAHGGESIVAITNAMGMQEALPDPQDFHRGQVYLYEGNVKAETRMLDYMRRAGIKMQVKANSEPFECRMADDGEVVCRNIRVESRNLVDLMH